MKFKKLILWTFVFQILSVQDIVAASTGSGGDSSEISNEWRRTLTVTIPAVSGQGVAWGLAPQEVAEARAEERKMALGRPLVLEAALPAVRPVFAAQPVNRIAAMPLMPLPTVFR